MSKVVVGGLLVLSLAANAYLLLTRGSPTSAPPKRAQPPPAASPPPRISTPTLADESSRSEYAHLDRARLEQRLATVEARLAKLLPLGERFDLAERSVENEARVKPFLDKVFKVEGAQKPAYEVECHDRICKLTVDESLAPNDWSKPLQTDPEGWGMFASSQFGGDVTFMELEEPARTAGWQAAIKLMTSLRGNAALAACKKQNPTPGEVMFTIKIDERHRFAVDASGTLANQAFGVCARRVIDELIATIALPPDAVLPEPLPIPIRVP